MNTNLLFLLQLLPAQKPVQGGAVPFNILLFFALLSPLLGILIKWNGLKLIFKLDSQQLQKYFLAIIGVGGGGVGAIYKLGPRLGLHISDSPYMNLLNLFLPLIATIIDVGLLQWLFPLYIDVHKILLLFLVNIASLLPLIAVLMMWRGF
jgi:hypothetical protein